MKVLIAIALMCFHAYSHCHESEIQLTHDVSNLADWIVESNDHLQRPFIIVDKNEAKAFVFLANGRTYSKAPILIGTTVGDETTPGVGIKKLADVRLQERTTPAGRFESTIGPSLNNTEILWIDYDAGVSMHTVVTTNPLEHRLQRLTSPHVTEHRITYGCINVSNLFYKQVIYPLFKTNGGVVYILPEVESILKVFGPEAERFSQRIDLHNIHDHPLH